MNTYTGKTSNLIKRLHVSRFRYILNWYDDRVINRPTWSYLKQGYSGWPMDRFFGDKKVNSKNRRCKN